ncbi:MAG: nucleotidyl transferase AbiEii/AbiGii toxin family protein [Acidobacteria bacterium]|nr:nucleotidyl transferase AbiEii/AbiGii toxin family protein [Acidobacteriota bacterium]
MNALLPEQADGFRDLQRVCGERHVDLVLIGAIAYRFWLPDEHRMTEDVDAVLGLDLDELPKVTDTLIAVGWRRDPRCEHRWHAPGGARFDLLPVGPKARREQQIVWPQSESRMTVVGFEHVFVDAVEGELATGLRAKVVPLVVLALLKMVSYLDDPHGRRHDLQDLVMILRQYEETGDRRFSDEVLDSRVEYREAGAYLLGLDLRMLCATEAEVGQVERFLRKVGDPDCHIPIDVAGIAGLDGSDADRLTAQQFAALSSGFLEGARGAT